MEGAGVGLWPGCLAALAVLVVPASARALVVDLPQALALARERNPTLRSAAADVDAARGRQRQSGLWPDNPVLWLEGSSHTSEGTAFFDRGISLEQAVEVGGQRAIRVAAA